MKFNIKTVGSDPEFFVFDPKGKPYPATLFAKGTKDNPEPIIGAPLGFFEQRDNLSFEGNIPPATNKEDFIYNVTFLREYFEKKVAKFKYSLSPNGVEYFDRRYLKTPEGMEFGCSKVISAWDSHRGFFNQRATPVLNNVKYRVSGFHLHIGYRDDVNPFDDILVARLFDLFLTMPSHRIKPEQERLWSYGKYGMIRSKSYGVECRTLSAYFTQKEWLPWVWDQLMKMESFINSMDDSDCASISTKSYLIGSTEASLRRVFKTIFYYFKHNDILTKFAETKDIYEDKTINIPDSNKYSYGWYASTPTSTSA